jgi:hypothetical protein
LSDSIVTNQYPPETGVHSAGGGEHIIGYPSQALSVDGLNDYLNHASPLINAEIVHPRFRKERRRQGRTAFFGLKQYMGLQVILIL